MTFTNLSFFLFFPLAALAAFLVPKRYQNAALLAASYLFYACNTPAWLPVLALDSVAVWLLVKRMDRAEGAARRRWLWAALGATVGLLVLLKGLGTLVYGAAVDAGLWAGLARFGLANSAGSAAFSIVLPLGISFFTVQALGYAMDVYRKKYAPEESLVNFALFTGFFCLISSGPIMRGDKLLPQLRQTRRFDAARAPHALVTLALGYLFKAAIADVLAVYVNAVYADVTAYTGLSLTAAALGFGLQLYFDFAGYSLLALGTAELLGLSLMTNFDTPYFSRSIKEFWGRWHISFSSWLKDYVYIPLGGNRKGPARKCVNLLLTFLVSGLWHGVGWTFVIWGLLHGMYQVVENLTAPLRAGAYRTLHLRQNGRLASVWQCLVTFLMVNAAWVFFRAGSVADAVYVLTAQFRGVSPAAFFSDFLAVWNAQLQTGLLVYAAVAFLALGVCLGVLLDVWRRFWAPGHDLSGAILGLPALPRWLCYYALAGCVFAGFLLNNGYYASAASFLYNNF